MAIVKHYRVEKSTYDFAIGFEHVINFIMEQFRYIFRVQCRLGPKRTFTVNNKIQVKAEIGA
ncbi:hypothetical protein D1AOALGA4SA_12760 [Olavius algarvensis Delta 1 endosymbiont]|nr:hypothetical protein D1AOALGA4SA_12760 [Olavius algarvensis Delta 1 endosymbiont]